MYMHVYALVYVYTVHMYICACIYTHIFERETTMIVHMYVT